MKPITNEVRAVIIQRTTQGFSIRAIAQELHVSCDSVVNIIKFSYCEVPPKHYGCPRKLGVRDKRKLVCWVVSDSCRSAVEASKRLKQEKLNSTFSVRSQEGTC